MTIVADDQFVAGMRGDYYVMHPVDRRVRAMFGGEIVADTTRPYLRIEMRDAEKRARDLEQNQFWMGLVLYYWPAEDVRWEFFVDNGERRYDARIGGGRYYGIKVGDRMVDRAAWVWDEPLPGQERMAGLVGMQDLALQALIEEEDQVFGPRNPYHAAEVRLSSRHIRIEFDGVEIADTRQPRMLYESGLPTRFYIPRQDVRTAYLEPAGFSTGCPYKGSAEYWNLRVNGTVHEGLVWCYEHPYPNVGKIEHLLGFYEERGFDVFVDGERRVPPGSPFRSGFWTKPTARVVGE